MSPRAPSSQKSATREKILDAALEVFAARGYHRASVDDIVRASSTSKGAVYHHFPNKEAIFLALVDDFARRLAAAGDERLARLILLEAVSLGPTYEAKRAEIADRFAALIQRHLDEAVSDDSITPLDTRVATLAWLGAINEVVAQWLHGGLRDLGPTIPTLTRLLLRSIGAGRD